MKIKVGGFAAIVGAAALWFALPALGQSDPQVSFNGNTDGASYNGVAGGIYGGTVDGVYGVDNGMVCDDYQDHISSGESWAANESSAYSLGANGVANTYFGNPNHYSATNPTYPNGLGVPGYAQLAYLAYTMFNTSDITQQGYISGAMWYLAEGVPPPSSDVTAYITAANNAITAAGGAVAFLESSELDNLFVLTPTGSGVYAGASGAPQEMWWESVPEGGAALLYLLLAGAACFGAMRFSSRSQFGNRTA